MTFAKRSKFCSHKSGNRQNKKHISCVRIVNQPSSKRAYIRRKTNIRLESDTTINTESSQSDLYNGVYRVYSVGSVRSLAAARMKKSRDIKRLKDVILDKNKTDDQQALVLHSVLTDPELSNVVKIAGIRIKSNFENIAICNEHRRLAMLNLASSKNSGKGRVFDDRR